MLLPALVALDAVAARLGHGCQVAGVEVPPTMGARTLFALLYAGAVEGCDRWLRPAQVVRMSDAQAARTGDGERLAWAAASGERGFVPEGQRWYAENTRESVREVLRELCALGAVVERRGLAARSPLPRWELTLEFARYLDASDAGAEAAVAWTPPAPAVAGESAAALWLAGLLERAAAEAVSYAAAHPDAGEASGLERLGIAAQEAAERLARSARQQPPAGGRAP